MGELSENITLSCPAYSKLLVDGIWNYFNKKEWTDVCISNDGYEVGVHRIILSIFSTNFAILTGGETNNKIEGLNVSQEDLSTILEFIYRGEINVVRQRLGKVKAGAQLLGLKVLVDAVDEFNRKEEKTKATFNNKRRLKSVKKATQSLRTANTGKVLAQRTSLRKKNPVSYLDYEEGLSSAEESENEMNSLDNSSLLENAILIELEDDDDGEEDDEFDEEEPEIVPPKNKRMKLSKLKASSSFDGNGWQLLQNHFQSGRVSSKHASFSYNCSECDFLCTKKLQLTRHMHNEHSKDRPYKCESCDYRGKTLSSLKSHSEMHSEEKFTCNVCSQKFTLSCSLNRHMKLHLSSEKKHACHLCDCKYKRSWDLKVHLKHTHNFDAPTTPKSNTIPEAQKAMQKFSCSICEYQTHELNRYKNHMESRHHLDTQGNPLDPKYKCEHCEFTCFSKFKLDSHSVKIHSEKSYTCEQCNFASPRNGDLKQHMLIKHSEKKSYMCETCGFQCATQRYLTRHKEVHQGNQHDCYICHMKFTLKSSLKRHIKLHIKPDDKPNACHFCSYTTRKRFNLKCHLKRIHNYDLYPPKDAVEKMVYQVL